MSLIVHVSVGMPKSSRMNGIKRLFCAYYDRVLIVCFTKHVSWLFHWESKGTTLPHPKNVVNSPFNEASFFLGRSFRVLWVFEVWTCVSGNCLIPANTSEIAKVNPHNASQVVLFAMCPRRIAQLFRWKMKSPFGIEYFQAAMLVSGSVTWSQ